MFNGILLKLVHLNLNIKLFKVIDLMSAIELKDKIKLIKVHI